MQDQRTLSEIAAEIEAEWTNVKDAARPYLDAMAALQSVGDSYGFESGTGVVLYFLANAGGWRGEVARRVKAELKAMVA
ncbi:hypothetical protein [Salininema proteolyticum]|uniref:Uncharacterized protein n=1 Tax=Salininema proteolyticum TaxID=1607685 RepID=A0ABV8TZP3_9ACTN